VLLIDLGLNPVVDCLSRMPATTRSLFGAKLFPNYSPNSFQFRSPEETNIVSNVGGLESSKHIDHIVFDKVTPKKRLRHGIATAPNSRHFVF
jgi:hypothetical protein